MQHNATASQVSRLFQGAGLFDRTEMLRLAHGEGRAVRGEGPAHAHAREEGV